VSDALLLYAGPYDHRARNVGQHLPQVELDRCTAIGHKSDEVATVFPRKEDRHERDKAREDQGQESEEVPAPSSVPMPVQVWPDTPGIRIGVHRITRRLALRRGLPVRRPTADQLLVRTGETVRKQR
jgi:hypothetical protein